MSANIVTLEQDIVVTRLTNPVYLVGEDGSLRQLAEGDVVAKGARLTSPTGAMVAADGRQIPIPMAEMTPDEQNALLTLNDPASGGQDDIAALQRAILDGIDPTQAFEASAAGGAPATGGGVAGGSGNGGFIVVDRSGDATLAQGGFDTTEPVTTTERRVPLDGRDDESLPDVTAPLISISAPDNGNDSTPTITGSTNAAPGSTVTLVVTDANGNQQSLTATVQPDGSFSVDVTTPLPDGGYEVTASVTDPAGNTGSATDNGSVDTIAGITVTLDDVNGSNVANAPITGTSDVGPGRTVTLAITDIKGDKVTVTALTDADGNYRTTADLSGLADGNLTVEASVTDAAGNRADASDNTSLLDTTAPDARITLDVDITADDIINAAEASQQIPVTGRVGGDVQVGDTVTLTVNGKTFTGQVLADKTFSITVPGADLVADGDKVIDVSVTTTDAAGNSSTATGSEGYRVDTQGPSVVVDIVATELKADESSVVTFTFSEPVQDFELADLTVVGGSVTGLTTSDDGKTWSATFTPTPDFEGTASVTVKDNSYTDVAGNQGSGERDSAAVDTQGPRVVVDIVATDLKADDTSVVTFTFSEPVQDFELADLTVVGGTVTGLTTSDDGKTWSATFTPTPDFEGTASVTVKDNSYTDVAGNQGSGERDSAATDTQATAAPTVVITEDTDNDGTIDRTEISGKVNVEVTLPAEALAGDTLKVSGQADRELTADDISAGKVGYEFDRPADGVKLTVTATLVDAAGNVSPEGRDSAVMGDTTATAAPTVVITEDTDNDGTIDRTEIAGPVNVEVTLPAEAKTGDTLKVSGQTDRVLTADDISAGKVGYEFDRPADGATLTVTASLVDAAGNVSPEGSDSAVMGDTTATVAPTVLITEDTDNDGTIDRTEISGKVNVAVTLPVEAKVGDTLKVSGQADRELTADDISAGKVGYEFDRPADGVKLTVTATLVDAAGNVSPEGRDSAVMGDTTATAAPTVVITEDTDNDGTIERTEIDGMVGVQVTLPTGAVAGDVLNVTGQAPITLTQAQIDGKFLTFEYPRPVDGGSIEVKATLTDAAGNVSPEGRDSAVMGDTTATAAPTVVITEDTDNDGTIDRTEISGKVNVEVTLPGEALSGDTLKVSGQADRVLTADDISAGKVGYEFDRPADGATLTVTATIVDAAGNESQPGSDSAVMGDTTATAAPTVVITEDTDNDGTIDRTEIAGPVNVEVTLPAEAKAGDTLKVSGQADRVLTADDISAGKVGYEFDRPADGATLTVTASLVDAAGNVSQPGSDSAVMGDTTATVAPTVVITEDTDNDGTIDRTEIAGPVNVEVTLPAEAKAGDVLNVTGQAPITLTQAQIDGKVLTFEYPRPADGGSIEVKATLTDAAGNVSPEGSDSAVMGDTTATAAPTVVITEDTDNDGTIDRTEISGKVNVEVTLPGEAQAGDVLNVTGQAPITLTQAQIDGQVLTFEYPRPVDGGSIEVKATLTDAAGNVSLPGSDSAVMGDTTATAAPTVVITEDTDNDGTIDRTEISGKVNVEVTLPGEALSGDTLKVSGQADRVLTADDISAGKVGYEFDRPADGATLTVTATLVDAAGNVSPEGRDSAVMGDTTATAAPTVVITEDTNNDGTIDRTEIAGPVNVEVTLPAEAKAGDVLNVTGQAPITLTQAQIDGQVLTFEYPRPADGGSIEVKATLTDQAGNVSPEGSDSAVMGDTTATGAPTVVITEDTDNDGTIDRTEIDGTVGVQITLPAGAVAGDVLNVTGQTPITLTQAQIDGKFLTFEYPRPADGGSIEVKATLTDQAGNVSPEGSDSAVMGDTTATVAPTVLITEDTNNDGTISRTEIDGTVGVKVTLPAGAVVGDVLNVTGQTPITLTQAQIDGKFLTFEYPRPADGGSIEVKATLTDAAGNVSPEGRDSAVMGDTTATAAPTVVITEDTDNDGTIDRTEISGKVNVEVTLPGEAQAGDVLNVTGQAPITLTQAQIDGQVLTFEYPRPVDGGSIEVKATLTDAAGNVSLPGSDSAVMGDTTATAAPTVVITEDTDNDGTIDRTEIAGPVNVEVTLPAEAKAGDTLKVSGQADRVLTADDISAGKVGYEFDRPADGATLTVTATLVDAAGNVSPEGSDSAVMGDTTATAAPTVVITEDTDNDGTIDRTEISGKVNVEVTLPGEALAGDTLKVSGQADRVLTADDISAGKVGYEFDRPADGATLTVTATIVDAAGNESLPGSDSAVMGDTTATAAPTVVITEDTNNDGTIDRTEISGKVNVEVTLPAEALAGDTLKVGGQADRVLTADDISAGKVGYEFDRPADGVKLTVTATIVDAAGNESLPGSDSAVMGDTTATAAPTVVITEDTNNDGTIDRTEISGKVNVEVTLPGEALAGDTLKVSGQADRVLTADDISAGKVGYEFDRPADGATLTVTATLVDAAGNVSPEGRDSVVMGDTTATAAPTVVITEDTDNDGTIDRTEIAGPVNVEVTLLAEAKAGDTLKVSGQADRVLTADDISAGKVGYEFDRPADGATLTVTATLVDAAGNVSLPGCDSAVMGDTTATAAPTVVITEDTDNDGTIDRTEIAGPVNVEVTLPAEAKAGDTLKVSGQADRVLTADDISAGKVGYEFDRPADGATLTVTATIVDAAGNESLPGSDSAVMGDTTATAAPTVVITEDTDNDGTISRTEIDGTVGVKVTLPAGAVVGDVLNVTGQTPITLTQAQIDGQVLTFEYPRPADGGSIEVKATLTDAAGNVSPEGSDSAVMGDTTATAAPTVVITEDTDNDGTIDRTEISGKVNVAVTLPAEAKAGDVLNVTGQAPITLTQAQIDGKFLTFEYPRLADGGSIEVKATLTDAAGNVSPEGRDSAVMGDTTATAAPTVVITEDTDNNGTIDRTEIAGPVNVEVTLPAEAKAGDTLKVSGQTDRVLTADDISAGKVGYEFDRPADGVKLTVTATLVDAAGNVSQPGSDSAVMGDTTATATPTVVITEDTDNDGTIDRTEIEGPVNVEVTLPGEALAGDTLKVSGQADRVLTADDISAGKVGYEFDRPADGATLTVTATIVDAAGNESLLGSDSAVMGDTTATAAPTVVITEDTDNDGTIDRTEIAGPVNVEVTLPAEAKAGDTLKVSGQADRVLTADDISAGKVGYEFDRPADGATLTVTATIVDAAGNESLPGSDSAVMGDTTATAAPTVVITEDTDNDGTIDRTEIDGTVGVKVTLPAGAVAGDVLNVTGQAPITLTQAQIDGQVLTFEYPRPADGGSIEVKATLTDAAGNVSPEGSDSAVMGDTTATVAPTVLITEDTDNDGTISRTEIDGTVGVKVTLPAGAVVGDVLNVTGQAPITLTQAQIDGKFLTFEYPRPADGGSIEVKATLTDAAGNVSPEGSDSAVMGDTTATAAPTVVITEDTDNDGTIDRTEISGKVNVEVTLPGEAQAGDVLNVTGQAPITLTQAQIDGQVLTFEYPRLADGGSIEVKATLTDAAGNVSPEGRDSAVMGDTTATAAPTVVITEDTDNDGTIDRTEVSGPVNVEVTLPAEAKVGDTLKVSGQTDRQLSEADILAGKVGYEFDRPADGATLTVTATLVDAAGNVSQPGSDSATMYHDAPPVTIGGHGIGLEDIPLVLAWDQFGASDDQADGELSVVIGSLPQNGTLQYLNAAGQWVAVKVGDSITSGEIKAGQLRLVPGSHESSTDNSNGQGNDSGNLKGDYASFEFKVSDGTQLSNSGTLVIDIEAVADKPVVEVTLSSNGTPLYQGFPSFGISTDSFQSGNIDYVALGVGDPKRDASSSNDQLNGSNTKNDYLLSSKGGGDMLYGKGGDDLLVGGNADQGDSLYGGTGNDILVAGLGNDGLYGGTGDDIAVLRGNRADYVVQKGSGHSIHDAWFDFSVNEGGTGVTKALHDIEHVQFDDGIYAINQATGELTMVQPTQVDYPVDIKVSLTDRDGSEVLDSLLLSGLPAGSKLYQGSDLLGTVGANGTLSLPASSGLWNGNALDVSLSGLTLRVPGAQAGQVDLKVEATTRELHTDQTNTASDDDSIRLSYFQGTEGEQGDQTRHYGSEHNLVVGDLDGSVVLSGQNYNIAFIVDSSGSIGDEAMVTIRTQLEQVFTSLKASAGTDNAGTVNLLLVDFDTTTRGSVSVNLADSGALKTLLDALKGMSADGGTNYEAAFSKAANWFAGSTATSNVNAKNLAYFITDGKPTFYDLGTTTRLSDVKVIDWAYSSDDYLNSTSLNLGNYVLGNTVTYRGVEVVNSKGEVIKWSQGWDGWFTTTVGVIVKGSNGQNQIQLLGGDGRNSTDDVRTDALLGYQLLTSKGVLVEAIGLGANISEADLKSYDSDGITHTNVDASDLASTILGATNSNLPGSDRFDGGAGDDILFGDAMHFNGIAGEGYAAIKAYVADKLNQNAALDAEVHRYIQQHASEFDQSSGNDKADVLMGGEGSDILYGQGGNDILDGGSGDDILFGGVGNDTLYGGLGDDSLHGGSGTDTLYGGEGNDILNGGTGDDWLIGGLGNDILTGADGSDIFVWSKGDIEEGKLTVDTITDFNPSRDDASQRDKLDLRDLLDQDDTQHPDDLKSLLSVFQDDEGVHLQVKTSASSEVAQEIVLVNHSFDTLTGNSGATSSQVIDFMLNNHMLEIDK